ncbi:MAG: CRTAC1 family protein [Acidobacteriota bacterium]|nr:CRTAC1 family protein [Blastocatellia bacterium]MDW8240165.1 CRTAC1 family protein [Acidobacteriota bacterium]
MKVSGAWSVVSGQWKVRVAAVVAIVLTVLLSTQGRQKLPPANKKIQFVEVTAAAKITWRHDNLATPEKYLIETMGGGGAFLDYDNDGWLDIYLVNSGETPFHKPKTAIRNALYRNNRDGTFSDVTEKAGVMGRGFGMGATVADYDNDGLSDIYVTNFGPNILYRNNGDGTFTDVTDKAGVGDPRWSTSAAFFDYDNDGRLDLFVCNYLDWNFDKNVYCGESRPGYRAYCHPDVFRGIVNTLYRNNGDGTFTDVSAKTGISSVEGKALGVVAADYNDDGWIDIYVANDAVRNFLFKNDGQGRFREIALMAEVAYGLNAKPESGMGVDFGDYNGDGKLDLFVTNIDLEPNRLHRYEGDDRFFDATVQAGLAEMAMLYSGFGTRFVDFDNDGDLDIFVTNGHPLDNVHLFREGVYYAEEPFLLENINGVFRNIADTLGEVMKRRYAGRGLASGDYDNDGDTDFLLINCGQPPVLIRNDGGNRNNWIGLKLIGVKSNRDAIGATVIVKAQKLTIWRSVNGGGSYCSGHDMRLLVGLGQRQKVDEIEIRWPSGTRDRLRAPRINRYVEVREGATNAEQKR